MVVHLEVKTGNGVPTHAGSGDISSNGAYTAGVPKVEGCKVHSLRFKFLTRHAHTQITRSINSQSYSTVNKIQQHECTSIHILL